MSYRFCPNCSTPLDWEIKPKARLLPPPTPKHTVSKSTPVYIIAVMLLASLILVALTATGYINYRSSFEEPLVFTGYDSAEEPIVESEVNTAPAGSQYTGDPPYVIRKGDSFSLINNSKAVDVTFSELKSFIFQDNTDSETYVHGTRMCGYFAETVHNNAEKAGIRAAVAIVAFEGDSTLHALNAFHTTDCGLVYIDCTGVSKSPVAFEEWLRKLFYPTGQDRIAYIEKGKEYGTIMLKDAESTQYSYFAGYRKSWISEQNFFLTQPVIVKSVTIYW